MKIPVGWGALAFALMCVVGGVAQQPHSPMKGISEPTQDQLETLQRSQGRSAKPIPPGQAAETGVLPANTQVSADSAVRAGAAGELIGFSGFDVSGSQTITLVHTGKMQMAVYHIDRSGRIDLISSRPIDADFSLSLNVTAPLPGQIRLLSGQVK